MKRLAIITVVLALLAGPAMSAPADSANVKVATEVGFFMQTGQKTVMSYGVSMGINELIAGADVDLIGMKAERGGQEFYFAKGYVDYDFSIHKGLYGILAPLGMWYEIKADGLGDKWYSAHAVGIGYNWGMLGIPFVAQIRAELANVTGRGDMTSINVRLIGSPK